MCIRDSSGIVHHSYLDSGRLQIIHDGCYLRTDNVRWDRAYSLNPHCVLCRNTSKMWYEDMVEGKQEAAFEKTLKGLGLE